MSKYTAADLTSINSMIVGGLKQAMIAGEMVVYRDLGELQRIQGLIEADLAAAPVARFAATFPDCSDRGL